MFELILVSTFFSGSIEGLLFKIAVACVVIWGIYELIVWMGWTIPRPVQIILICLVCILFIYWAFEIFEALK